MSVDSLLRRYVSERKQSHSADESLGEPFLLLAMLLALLLHVALYGFWKMLPQDEVIDIPVRVLNIKLVGNTPEDDAAILRPAMNATGIEQALGRMIKDMEPVAARRESRDKADVQTEMPAKKAANLEQLMAKSKPFDLRTEGTAVAAPVQSVVATQYVREAQPAKLGDAKGEDMITRYEQMISSWIDKFKPEKLMVSGQPERAVASVRIRIDRRGNIRFLELEKRSGLEELDRAALETVRRANPVPAVPADYPSGELVEFIVPIVFTR